MEKIRSHTELEAQKLSQLLRADSNFNIGSHRFHKDGQVPKYVTARGREGEFTFLLDGDQVINFFNIRKALIKDLSLMGLGDVAKQVLANRTQRMGLK